MVEISVIVPVYNVEKYISECIESILAQDFVDFEIICVDDCGIDKSMDIVREYAAKDDRIKIITHEVNKGLSASRNSGIDAARGKYIAFVDSDDWVDKSFLTRLYEAAESSAADVVECGFVTVDKNKSRKHKIDVGEYKGFIDILSHISRCFICIRLWKLDFLRSNNLRFCEGIYYEDIFLIPKAVFCAKKWVIVDYWGYFYRLVPTSITRDNTKAEKRERDLFWVLQQLLAWGKNAMLGDGENQEFRRFLARQCVPQEKLVDDKVYEQYVQLLGDCSVLKKARKKSLRHRLFWISVRRKKFVILGFNLWK